MTRKHQNPSFPTGLVVGAVLGAGALAWWLTRKTTASTVQALVSAPAPSSLSYHGDTQGHALTPAEIAAISASQFNAPLLPAEQAMLAQQRAALAAQQGRID